MSQPASSPPPLRAGIVGYGLAGSVFHAPLIAATPALALVAVVTGDATRADQARATYDGVGVFATAAEMVAKAELDLVVVAAPNREHARLARAAIDAGIAVVVDKPFAVTSTEAQSVLDAARARGVMLSVFQNRRFDGDFLTVQRLLGEGALGTVTRFESRFERWRPVPKGGWRESGDSADAGGLLFDLGAHLVDQALVLFGPVTHVYAEVDCRRPNVQVDDDVFVALTHASGVRSHLWCSAVASNRGPRMRVLGDHAAYVKYGLDGQEDALRRGGRPDRDPAWGMENEAVWGTLGVDADSSAVPTEPGAYQRYYAAVADALRTGTPPPVDPADAVTVLRVIEAARLAHHERRVVAVP